MAATDRGSLNDLRQRRALQALGAFGQADGITIGFDPGSGYSVIVNSAGGLQTTGGVGIKLASPSGLTVGSSGLAANPDGSTITINGSNKLQANLAAISPLTTKGDLFTFSTVNTRLPVGTDTFVLTADSTQSTGMKWAPGSAATVTSVGLALPLSTFSISGSPVTTSGTLTGSFITQNANTVLAGPTTGSAATPTWRTLVAADIPSLSYVTSVGLSLPAIFTVSGSPVTSSGTLTAVLATETANFVWAGPTTGAAAAPTFRALVAADIPVGGGSPLTTKGDLFTFSTVNARLGVGTNGQILIANSAQTTGLQWITANSDTSITASTSGLSVHLGTNSGLVVSSGLEIQLTNDTLVLSGSGIAVNLQSGSGLQDRGSGSGLGLQVNGTSLLITAGVGVGVNLRDTSLIISSGLGVNLATSSGLAISSGLKANPDATTIGINGSNQLATLAGAVFPTVSSDPGSPADGQAWYNTTSKLPKVRVAGDVELIPRGLATSIRLSVSNNTATDFGSITLPANYFVNPRAVRLHAVGDVILAIGNTWTLTATITDGTHTTTVTAFTSALGVLSAVWVCDLDVLCFATGSSGTALMSTVYNQNGVTTNSNVAQPTIDTTKAITIKFTGQLTNTSAGDSWDAYFTMDTFI